MHMYINCEKLKIYHYCPSIKVRLCYHCYNFCSFSGCLATWVYAAGVVVRIFRTEFIRTPLCKILLSYEAVFVH